MATTLKVRVLFPHLLQVYVSYVHSYVSYV